MSKFKDIQLLIGGLISSSGLELYPEDYKGNIVNEDLYGRYSFSVNNQERIDYDTSSSLDGILFIRIFFNSGEGSLVASEFADTLSNTFDRYKADSFSFDYSTISQATEDPDNENLSMITWQITFTKYL